MSEETQIEQSYDLNGETVTPTLHKLDILDEMKKRAYDLAVESMRKFSVEKDIADYIKDRFDEQFLPSWQCIADKSMIKFNMGLEELEEIRKGEVLRNFEENINMNMNKNNTLTNKIKKESYQTGKKIDENIIKLEEDFNFIPNSREIYSEKKTQELNENIASNTGNGEENKNLNNSQNDLEEIRYSLQSKLIDENEIVLSKNSKKPQITKIEIPFLNLNIQTPSKKETERVEYRNFRDISTGKKEEGYFFERNRESFLNLSPMNQNETIRLSHASNSNDLFSIQGFNNFVINCDELERKYDRKNIHSGKDFFKYRFISENALNERRTRDRRKSEKLKLSANSSYNQNLIPNNLPSTKINFLYAPDDKKVIKLNKLFLQKLEKSIFLFNIKSYEESCNNLIENLIIKDESEFAELILLTPGFDKNIIGIFLSSDKFPNKNCRILDFFIKKINFHNVKFTESLRFFLTRLNLPKDSTLILKIIEKFSSTFYTDNMESLIYPDEDSVYLLCSTVLAVNSLNSRKDLKNVNQISKNDFVKMNSRIAMSVIEEIFDDITMNKLDTVYEYNELIYKRLSVILDREGGGLSGRTGNYLLTDWEDDVKTKRINHNININININMNKEEILLQKSKHDNVDNKLCGDIDGDYRDLIHTSNIEGTAQHYQTNENKSYTKHPNQLEQDQTAAVLNVLKKGEIFLKYGRNGTPHLKHVKLSDDGSRIKWRYKSVCSKIFSKSKFILVKELVNVYIGTNNSKIFERYQIPLEYERFCMTIESAGRTLDLRKDNEEVCKKWYNGIKLLMSENYLTSKGDLVSVKIKKNNEKNRIDKNFFVSRDQNETLKNKNEEISFVWQNEILPKWKDFRLFIQMKIDFVNSTTIYYKKKKYFEEKLKDLFVNPKSCLIPKILEDKDKSDFVFFYSFYGIPTWLRKYLYSILIKNSLNVSEILFNKFLKNVEKIDFVWNNSTRTFKGVLPQNLQDSYLDNENNIKEEISYSNSIIDSNSPLYTIKEILNDVEKCFQKFKFQFNKEKFSEKDFKTDLFKILRIFTLERSDLPYSKNLAYIATIFLLNSENYYKAYVLFINFICYHSDFFFKFQVRDDLFIKARIDFFEKLFQTKLPKLFKHFKNLDIQTSLYFYDWFEFIFVKCFYRKEESFKFYQKLFDIFLIRGEVFLYEIGICLIQIQQKDLLSNSVRKCLRNLKKFPFDSNGKFTEEEILDCLSQINCVQEFKTFTEENILATEKGNLWESLLNY